MMIETAALVLIFCIAMMPVAGLIWIVMQIAFCDW